MGRRQRRRAKSDEPSAPVATTDYADPDGAVLTLRDELSPGTIEKVRSLDAKPAASQEDRWHRRRELLFERLAVRWEIAGLPLEGQRELLGRYRMADSATRDWVARTIDDHVAALMPELLE
jgi:hypothetical protein